MTGRLYIFYSIFFLILNICASEITNYAKEFMMKYIPTIHHTDLDTKKLINCVAYTHITRPKLDLMRSKK